MTVPVVTTYIPPVSSVGLPPDEVINALTTGVVDIERYAAIYESDGLTPMDIDYFDGRLVDGSITVDGTRDERRMCDIQLINDDRQLNLDPDNGFWYDKIIKVFWGIEYWSSGVYKRWEMQLGEFMIDTIKEDFFPNVTKITGRDYTKKCLVSAITNSQQFDPTTPVETIIRALAVNAGVTKFRLPYTGLSFTDPVVFDPGTPRWAVMKRIANSVGYEIYFTPDGFLTMRPYPDPATSPVTWAFLTGKPAGTLVKYTRSSDDSLVKNHCVVIGTPKTDDAGFSQVAFGEAINTNPSSPTRIAIAGVPGGLNDRLDLFKSEYITESSMAQAVAEARLKIAALEQFNIEIESLLIPFVDGGDIVTVDTGDQGSYVPTRFLFTNYTFPLQLGSMTGTAKRVTIVGSPRNYGVV
jgi:hypothetical protein